MKHALVVGGTGMLSKVSLWLVENDYHVSIIARNLERMKKLLNETRLEDAYFIRHLEANSDEIYEPTELL